MSNPVSTPLSTPEKKRETFCIIPFIHLSTKTSGTIRVCCESPDSDINPREVAGSESNQLQRIWNGLHLKEIRKKMLSGERVDLCNICYQKEDLGSLSRRMEHNAIWEEKLGKPKIKNLKEDAKKNEGIVETPPIYLDLRLGSKCNLKCRMCNTMTSTTFADEWKELQNKNKLELDLHFGEEQNLFQYSQKLKPWFEQESFWDELEVIAPTLKKLYLTGGEPMLIKKNLELLNFLHEKNYTDLEITLNTNATLINDEFLKLFETFQRPILSLSIDGVEKTFDYIRHPAKWQTLNNIFQKLNKYQINIDLTFTLQAYNFFEIIPFLEWINLSALEKVDYIDWNILDQPHYLAFDVLPQEKRVQYLDQLRNYLVKTQNNANEKFYQKLLDKFPILSAPRVRAGEEKQFLRYTRILDHHRGHKLSDEIPSLKFLTDLKI